MILSKAGFDRSVIFALWMASICFTGTLSKASILTERFRDALTKSQLLNEIRELREETLLASEESEKEKSEKLDWLFQLQFLVERRYGDADASLLRILKYMSELHATPDHNPRFLQFTDSLVESIETLREPNEHLWIFIRQYVETNSIILPGSSFDFAMTRDYVNRIEGYSAKTLSPLELDRLLSQLKLETEKQDPTHRPSLR